MPSRASHKTDAHPRPNDPPLLILTSLASGAKHGYALLQDIEAYADVRLGPGTLYGAISRLERRGLIEATAPAGRTRPYRLTSAGRAALESALANLRAIVEVGTTRLRPDPTHIASERPAQAPSRDGAPRAREKGGSKQGRGGRSPRTGGATAGGMA